MSLRIRPRIPRKIHRRSRRKIHRRSRPRIRRRSRQKIHQRRPTSPRIARAQTSRACPTVACRDRALESCGLGSQGCYFSVVDALLCEPLSIYRQTNGDSLNPHPKNRVDVALSAIFVDPRVVAGIQEGVSAKVTKSSEDLAPIVALACMPTTRYLGSIAARLLPGDASREQRWHSWQALSRPARDRPIATASHGKLGLARKRDRTGPRNP